MVHVICFGWRGGGWDGMCTLASAQVDIADPVGPTTDSSPTPPVLRPCLDTRFYVSLRGNIFIAIFFISLVKGYFLIQKDICNSIAKGDDL